jgi:hypothetical protein
VARHTVRASLQLVNQPYCTVSQSVSDIKQAFLLFTEQRRHYSTLLGPEHNALTLTNA